MIVGGTIIPRKIVIGHPLGQFAMTSISEVWAGRQNLLQQEAVSC
jgi:hypothetical protein